MRQFIQTKSKLFRLNSLLSVLFVGVLALLSSAQDGIPNETNPPKLYNNFSKDLPDFLSASEAIQLEKDLEAFAKSTSNQIVVVVVDDLGGYEPWEFATKLGDKWKVGHEKEDNGIVLLIKPTKRNGRRETFIATGRGLEGAIPDYTCNQIVENELLPNFKKENYYEGITAALSVLKSLSKGEFNSDQYAKENEKKDSLVKVIFVIIIIIVIVIVMARGNKGGGGRGMTMGSRGIFFGSGFGGGSWGGGSSGGGGGFGGFGGGSFGGGGSGGSW
jgi:uncharacterized protein